MDRDIYLILIGAGISLASSIVMLLLQFFLGIIKSGIDRKQQEKEKHKEEIRAELTRKDIPIHIAGPGLGSIEIKKITVTPAFYFKLFGQAFILDHSAVSFSALIGIVIFISQVVRIIQAK